MRPLRGHRQIAALARTHLTRVDVTHLGPEWRDDAAVLWEWLDLASFLLCAEEPDSIVDFGRREPTQRRRLYGSILDCARGIERRAGAVALAGTYEAATGLSDPAIVPVALVAFFPTASDPGAITRRTLLTPGSVDLERVWRAMCETEEERVGAA